MAYLKPQYYQMINLQRTYHYMYNINSEKQPAFGCTKMSTGHI